MGRDRAINLFNGVFFNSVSGLVFIGSDQLELAAILEAVEEHGERLILAFPSDFRSDGGKSASLTPDEFTLCCMLEAIQSNQKSPAMLFDI